MGSGSSGIGKVAGSLFDTASCEPMSNRYFSASSPIISLPTISPRALLVLDGFIDGLCTELCISRARLFDLELQQDIQATLSPGIAAELLRDLLLNIPLQDLEPGLVSTLLAAMPPETRAYINKHRGCALKDLRDEPHGSAIKQALKQDLKGLWDERPQVVVAGVAAAVAAAGYVLWTRGTGGLRKLGIKPEVVFPWPGGHVRHTLTVDFAPRLSDPVIALNTAFNAAGDVIIGNLVRLRDDFSVQSLDNKLNFKLGWLGLTVRHQFNDDQGLHLLSGSTTMRLDRRHELQAAGRLDLNDPGCFRISGRYQYEEQGVLQAWLGGTWDQRGRDSASTAVACSINVGLDLDISTGLDINDGHCLSLDIEWDVVQIDRLKVSGRYDFVKDGDFSLSASGSYDAWTAGQKPEWQVSAGIRFTW